MDDSERVRFIKIVGRDAQTVQITNPAVVEAGAHTWIPRKIWNDITPLYVGLEIYLPSDGDGDSADWRFTQRIIEAIRSCATDEPMEHP